MSPPSADRFDLLAAAGTRRRFLTVSGAAAGLAMTSWLADPFLARASVPSGPDPFTLGVASGDPLPDAVVLWTRLAPEPLDPSGGMAAKKFPVRWEVAEDEAFRKVVRKGQGFAQPEFAHTVHADATGLRPGREYFYRFHAGPHTSPTGRTKTAPPAGAALAAFAFAFVSCQNYPNGYYTAYRHVVAEDIELVVHLGDYIYEGEAQGTIGRGHLPAGEIMTLADYRVRLAQYKTDPDLQAAHAHVPWLVTWDDHEVENNYADEISEDPAQSPDAFLLRRAGAYRAYWEHMPLRLSLLPKGPDMPLYRRSSFGDLVEFNVLDTRQYRSDQSTALRADPARSITGDEQERWLLDGMAASPASWNVLAQQVFFTQRDLTPGTGVSYSNDAWDGYVASRDRVTGGLVERQVRNPVVLTGDVHKHYAADIKVDYDDPASAIVGSELVGTSISTGGDGGPLTPALQAQLADNPHIKYVNQQRGYVRCDVTHAAWRADFKVLPFVTAPGAPVLTDASFTIEAGSPGLQPS